MEVTWEPSADRLLKQRDRFTQQAIRREFIEIVGQGPSLPPRSIEFDAAEKGYLTSVAEERYSVIWYKEEDDRVVVRAVVPTTRFSRGMPNLKARVQEVVRLESHGAVAVK